MMSEKIELLGKNCYTDIPSTLTLKSFPTVTELDYVSSEDFEKTMLDEIFPKCIEEKIKPRKLLEIDFQWICRGLRFLNYGPYHTTNLILCDQKDGVVRQEWQVDLRTIGCKPLPDNFVNDVVIHKEEFIDYDKDVHLHLLTIQEALDARSDKLFVRPNGDINTELARICYSIASMGEQKNMTPMEAKIEIQTNMSNPDYKILVSTVAELTDYGLRGGGTCVCPKCHSTSAAFFAPADDRYFRPTVGDLKQGRNDRSLRGMAHSAGDTAETV